MDIQNFSFRSAPVGLLRFLIAGLALFFIQAAARGIKNRSMDIGRYYTVKIRGVWAVAAGICYMLVGLFLLVLAVRGSWLGWKIT